MADPIKSTVIIAKLLGSSGYDEFAVGCVKKYWRRNCEQPRAKARNAKKKRAFSALVKEKLNDSDRIVLGQFLSMFAKMNFDAGLRIGLTTTLVAGASDHPDYGEDEAGRPADAAAS